MIDVFFIVTPKPDIDRTLLILAGLITVEVVPLVISLASYDL